VSSREGRKVETGMSLDGWRKQAAWEQRWPRTADCSRVCERDVSGVVWLTLLHCFIILLHLCYL